MNLNVLVCLSVCQSAATAPTMSIPVAADSLDHALDGLEQAGQGAAMGPTGASPAAGEVSYEVRSGGRLGDRWERHVTTLAVLMAYTELLLLLCRFPRWGLRVLMFYKVAINVIKVGGIVLNCLCIVHFECIVRKTVQVNFCCCRCC